MEIPGVPVAHNPSPAVNPGPQKPKKKRVRNWTAEDRAVHREFEKSRREAFSERLMELTKLLPALRSESRPSKHIIVDASIAHHQEQAASSRRAAEAIESLIAERDDLLKEVNHLRSLCQPGNSVPRQARPLSPGVREFLTANKLPAISPIAASSRNLSIATVSDHASPESLGPFMPVVSEDHLKHASMPLPTAHSLPNSEPVPPPGHNLVYWNWSSSGKETASMPIDLVDEASMLWNNAPDNTITTLPKDVNSEYSPSHLVNNSAMFWTHHPEQINPTIPQEGPHFDRNTNFATDNRLLWAPHLQTPTTISSQNRNSANLSQIIHSNSLISHHSL